eukprot:TRINITY_DN32598_c0_g2_i1.p1 TRINITY_DN32598_c0_g2~~TRINITY_DN32598_c0_g2_i1.p1  ORF type:complete len:802 (+),score=189.54 TRINITY_DN32598_c0_g2_i1:99-2504(+)
MAYTNKSEYAGGLSDHHKEMKEFLRHWGIDGPNAVDLMLCSYQQQLDIMDRFKPDAASRNINEAFHNFLLRMTKDPIAGFAGKFGLNQSSEDLLRGMNWKVQREVMEKFAPKPNVDVDTFFQQFASTAEPGAKGKPSRHIDSSRRAPEIPADKSSDGAPPIRRYTGDDRSNLRVQEPPKSKPPPPSSRRQATDPLTQFAEELRLDKRAEQQLRNLPTDLQTQVMETFDPPAAMQNPSAVFMKHVQRTSDRVKFIRQWGLDERAERRLLELTPELQANVMETFSPPAGAQNPSSTFMSFVQKFCDPILVFSKKWGLDERAHKKLLDLTPSAQEVIMESFHVPPDVQNVSSAFMKFVHQSVTSEPLPRESRVEQLSRFVRDFNLNEASEAILRGLDRELQSDVMKNFTPAHHIKDMDGLFQNFASTRRIKRGSGDDIARFVGDWELDEECEQYLRDAPVEMMEHLIDNFAPRSQSKDVKIQFKNFARSREQNMDSIADFVAKHSLNEESERMLRDLPIELQEDVIENFRPAPHIRHIDSLLQNFASTRFIGSKGRKKARPPAEDPPVEDAVTDYCAQLGLDERAEEELRELPVHLQDEVILNFRSTGTEKNISAVFCKYLHRFRGPLDEVSEFLMKFGLDDRSGHALRELTDDLREHVVATYFPNEDADINEDFTLYVRECTQAYGNPDGSDADAQAVADEVARFVAKFNIEQEAEDTLRSMSAEQQLDIMANFRPAHHIKDVTGLLLSFMSTRKTPRRRRAGGDGEQREGSAAPWKGTKGHGKSRRSGEGGEGDRPWKRLRQ